MVQGQLNLTELFFSFLRRGLSSPLVLALPFSHTYSSALPHCSSEAFIQCWGNGCHFQRHIICPCIGVENHTSPKHHPAQGKPHPSSGLSSTLSPHFNILFLYHTSTKERKKTKRAAEYLCRHGTSEENASGLFVGLMHISVLEKYPGVWHHPHFLPLKVPCPFLLVSRIIGLEVGGIVFFLKVCIISVTVSSTIAYIIPCCDITTVCVMDQSFWSFTTLLYKRGVQRFCSLSITLSILS